MLKYLLFLIFTTAALHAEVKILAFAGSTRQDSDNKKLLVEAAKIAQQSGATVTLVDLKNFPMPFYDGDLEKERGMPENAKRFRKLLMENDVIFIASPEYNHSVSPVLKNTLDWASRSEAGTGSREAFEGKKFVLFSASPGKKGGARGLTHLRDILNDVKGNVLPQEFSLGESYNAFNEQNRLKKPETAAALKQFVQTALE